MPQTLKFRFIANSNSHGRYYLYLAQALPYDDAKVGAAVAVRSFGDFQTFHPNLPVPAIDGYFHKDAAFMVCSSSDTGELCSNWSEIAIPS